MSEVVEPVDKLVNFLGFDSAKRGSGGTGVLKDALAIITKEREEEFKNRAIELIRQAIKVRDEMDSLEKQFQKQMKKSAKELTKLMSRIENMGSGAEEQETEDE